MKPWDFPREYVVKVLEKALELHRKLPTLVDVAVPAGGRVNICGDTHGQFFDVVNIFSDAVLGPATSSNVFLFNGDLVDRGRYSFEVAFFLLALKVESPASIHVLRGNHETMQMNKYGGFEDQVVARWDREVLDLFRQVFQALPLCAVVRDGEAGMGVGVGMGAGAGVGDGSQLAAGEAAAAEVRRDGGGGIFVTHGGIGPASSQMTLQQLRELPRFCEPFAKEKITPPGVPLPPSALDELLWCDPIPEGDEGDESWGLSLPVSWFELTASESASASASSVALASSSFGWNIRRGLSHGFSFRANATHAFLLRNGLELLVRSHECCAEGMRVDHGGRCITVFSAPNYMDSVGNLGAALRVGVRVTEGAGEGGRSLELEPVLFKAVPHPLYKPPQVLPN